MVSSLFDNFTWGCFSVYKTEVKSEEISDCQFIKLKQIAKGNCFIIISKENIRLPF